MEDIDPGITEAIAHAVEAGKLRTYVRENDDGLAGLARLADRHSAEASRALGKTMDMAPRAKLEVRDRPGSR